MGIDLSLTSTGLAYVGEDNRVECIRIKSAGKKTATLQDRRTRLASIHNKISVHIPPDALVVIEQPAFSRTTGHMHDRSGLWWLIVDYLSVRGNDVVEVAPTVRAKYATGKGNAGKDQVLAATVKRYPDVDVTGNDIADAVILAALGRRWLGAPIDNMPAAHTAVMASIAWPVTR